MGGPGGVRIFHRPKESVTSVQSSEMSQATMPQSQPTSGPQLLLDVDPMKLLLDVVHTGYAAALGILQSAWLTKDCEKDAVAASIRIMWRRISGNWQTSNQNISFGRRLFTARKVQAINSSMQMMVIANDAPTAAPMFSINDRTVEFWPLSEYAVVEQVDGVHVCTPDKENW